MVDALSWRIQGAVGVESIDMGGTVPKKVTLDWSDLAVDVGSRAVMSVVRRDKFVIGHLTPCKDYLTDRLIAAMNGGGQVCRVEVAAAKFDRPRVAFSSGDLSLEELHRIQRFVNDVEDYIGLERSSFRVVENSPQFLSRSELIALWIGEPRWLLAPPFFGLWTVLLRTGTLFDGQSWSSTLANATRYDYMTGRGCKDNPVTVARMIELVKAHSPERLFGTDRAKSWARLANPDAQHMSVGPMSYMAGISSRYHPEWLNPQVGA